MNPIKIFIADDQTLFREGMATVLNTFENIEVIGEAENGKVLLEKLDENNLPELILLDLKMPVLNGVETLKILKQKFPSVKVVILTMHDEEDYIVELLEMGANSYLLKDSRSKMVEETIRKVVETGYWYNETIQQILARRLISKKRPKRETSKMFNFSEQELEVLGLICKGFSNSEIGQKVHLSPRTIEGYKKRLQEKTGSANTIALVTYALKNGLTEE
jgi:two-component system, NarL family, response regulator DegU